MNEYFITFRSVTYAQRGERVLASGGIRCTLTRTPKWMEERGCGYCLRLRMADAPEAVELLRQQGVPMRKVYTRRGDGAMEEVTL